MPHNGLSPARIFLYRSRIKDFVLLQENKGQIKPVFWDILRIYESNADAAMNDIFIQGKKFEKNVKNIRMLTQC